MSTNIEWTHRPDTIGESWNPVTGCEKVSRGCERCYAMHMSWRLSHNPVVGDKYKGTTRKTKGGQVQWTGKVTTHYDLLKQPLKWVKPRTVFVCSMSDLFHEDVPVDFVIRLFAVMAACPQHTFQILTKRPARMEEALNNNYATINATYLVNLARNKHMRDIRNGDPNMPWPLPNVWLGTSVENDSHLDRVDHLLQCPATIRYLSCEPLVGPLDISEYLKYHETVAGTNTVTNWRSIGWVIAGGESGKDAQPVHPDWIRSLRDQCVEAGVPFFFKQWGAHAMYDAFPIPLDHLVKTKYYWKDGAFTKVKYGDPASVLNNFPIACKTGKKEAGNKLDGQQWEQWPEVTLPNPKT